MSYNVIHQQFCPRCKHIMRGLHLCCRIKAWYKQELYQATHRKECTVHFLLMELQTVGNIRFEEGSPTDPWYSSRSATDETNQIIKCGVSIHTNKHHCKTITDSFG